MLSNINNFEHFVRLVTGMLIGILYLTGSIAGGTAHFLAVIGVLLIVTGLISYCPLYSLCTTLLPTKKHQAGQEGH